MHTPTSASLGIEAAPLLCLSGWMLLDTIVNRHNQIRCDYE
jgi:hypothetical protein